MWKYLVYETETLRKDVLGTKLDIGIPTMYIGYEMCV